MQVGCDDSLVDVLTHGEMRDCGLLCSIGSCPGFESPTTGALEKYIIESFFSESKLKLNCFPKLEKLEKNVNVLQTVS